MFVVYYKAVDSKEVNPANGHVQNKFVAMQKNRSGPRGHEFTPCPEFEYLPGRYFSDKNTRTPICSARLLISRMRQNYGPERSHIMNIKQNQIPSYRERLREIPKWTRKYAQNRTLTILVLIIMTTLLGMFVAFLVGFPLALAVAAFRKGNIILGCVGIAVLVAVLAALVKFYIFIFAKFGGKNKGLLDQIIDDWIYGREGIASIPMPEATKRNKWLEITIAIVWGCLFMGTMYLGMVDLIPAKYLQPVSAFYCVPYMVVSWYFWRSPRIGPVFLLSPILYAIHAVLILAGVPIFFTSSNAAALNMSLPLLGYGFLAFIIGHLYSRYALKKLRGITHLEGDTADED